MKKLATLFILLVPAWSAAHAASADTIVASIKPLHSLVQTVAGTDEVELLLEADTSPHHFSLKPSQMRSLQQASVIFYIDPSFEWPLHKALKALPARVRAHAVAREAGLVLLPVRKEGAWEAHRHHPHESEHGGEEADGHGHEHEPHEREHDEGKADGHGHDHESHGHEHGEGKANGHGHEHESHGHGHGEGKADGHGHEHESHGHEHGEGKANGHGHEHERHEDRAGYYDSRDMHVWLDMENAVHIVQFVARTLSAVNPAKRGIYEANAAAFAERAAKEDAQLSAQLAAVRERPFIVFHDAYQYFERRYGLTAAGSITAHPGRPLSVHTIRQLRDKIKSSGAVCVFREPQFSDKAVNAVIRNSSVKIGVLDPLGAELQSGADLYFNLLARLAQSARSCLL